MSSLSGLRSELDAAIDAIESGYEFMLAYAAQGRRTDRDSSEGPRVRLQAMAEALQALPSLASGLAAVGDTGLADAGAAFFDQLQRDAAVATAVIRLVLAQADIGSQLIDNLNASIHLRAVLTDIFLLDEVLPAAESGSSAG